MMKPGTISTRDMARLLPAALSVLAACSSPSTPDDDAPFDEEGEAGGDVTAEEGQEPACGNGVVEEGEHCDDGNDIEGDGCNGISDMWSPPSEVSGLSGAVAISAGGSHACAALDTGGLKCWGGNGYGQLGNGEIADQLTPIEVPGLTSGVAAVSAGGLHTCVLLETGGVKCWGWNGYGQLGDGTTVDALTPVNVEGLSSRAAKVIAGDRYSCALLDTGGVQCWGVNSWSILGDGSTEASSTPVDVIGLGPGVSTLSGGYDHWCAVLVEGGVRCWGSNEDGRLGDGSWWYTEGPLDVIGLTAGVRAIAAGSTHTCAVTEDGEVQCWGSDDYGQSSGLYSGYPHLVACR